MRNGRTAMLAMRPFAISGCGLSVSRQAMSDNLEVETDSGLRRPYEQEANQAEEGQNASRGERQPVADRQVRDHLDMGTRGGFQDV